MGWWGVVGIVLAGFAFVVLSFGRSNGSDGQSRGWPKLAPGFALATVLAIMIGCGGSKSNGTTNTVVNYNFAVQVPSTQMPSSGAITVNAAIGGINHTAQITVNTQ